jgi:hypothetical protein
MLRGKDIENRAREDLREIGPEEELEIMERLDGGTKNRKRKGKKNRREPSSERETQSESGTEDDESEEDQQSEEETRKRRRGSRAKSHRTGAEAIANRENKKRTRETRNTTSRKRKKKKGESTAISSDYQKETAAGQTYNTGSELHYDLDEEETIRLLREYRRIIEGVDEDDREPDQLKITSSPQNMQVETQAARRRKPGRHFVLRSTGTV